MDFVSYARERPAPLPVTVFAGPERFLLRRGWEIFREGLPERTENIAYDAREVPWERVRSELRAIWLGAPPRAIRYLWPAGTAPPAAVAEEIRAYAQAPSERTWMVLMIEGTRAPSNLEGEGIRVVECARPDAHVLRVWLASEFRRRGKEPGGALLDRIQAAGAALPMEALQNLVETLVAHAGADRDVAPEDVDCFVVAEDETTAFRLADFAAEGRVAEALEQLEILRAQGAPPEMVLGGLAYQARRWVQVRRSLDDGKTPLEIARALGIKYVDRVAAVVRRHAADIWLAMLGDLMEADRDMKTGVAPWTAIEAAVVRMATRVARPAGVPHG